MKKIKTIKFNSTHHYDNACAGIVNFHSKRTRTNHIMTTEEAKVLVEQLKQCIEATEGEAYAIS